MGSFSWLFANKDKKTNPNQLANVAEGHPFKFLIPKEFGGGFILDKSYGDYGYLDNEKYDMYEILAFWNLKYDGVEDILKYDGEFPNMKQIDDYTDYNRCLGIQIGCYDSDMSKLKYPLKLVTPEFNGTYEDCPEPSYSDPNQGWGQFYLDGTCESYD